ncbi:MAG: hypothetical protein HC798_03030 [Polaribacter sp.]|nr:hypothetical protein [Polaribacter sp.]
MKYIIEAPRDPDANLGDTEELLGTLDGYLWRNTLTNSVFYLVKEESIPDGTWQILVDGTGNNDGITYKGMWDANANTPPIADGVGTNGDFYIVGTAGTTTVDGENDWEVGDWLMFEDTTNSWQKMDNSDRIIPIMTGATGAADGVDGLAPKPLAGDNRQVLYGDATYGNNIPEFEPNTEYKAGFSVIENGVLYTRIADGNDGAVFTPANWTMIGEIDSNTVHIVRANATLGVLPTAIQAPNPVAGDTAIVFLTNGVIEYYSHNGTVWTLNYTETPTVLDGNDIHLVRANNVQASIPTAAEVPTPVIGDTAKVILANSIVEYWSYNGTTWILDATITPATLDGNRVNVIRADAVTGVAPSTAEVANPINGDTAVVFLNDGVIEYYAHNGTAWALVNTVSPTVLDGNDHHIERTNTTENAAPTAVEIPTPMLGDTAKVHLSNNTIEYWSNNGTTWTKDFTVNGNDNLFTDGLTQAATNTITANNYWYFNGTGDKKIEAVDGD